MEVKLPLDEKILKFASENDLYIEGQCGRDRKCREAKFYTIFTEDCLVMASINPDCTYEQFLEKIANSAIFEAERLYNLNEEMEREYRDLWDDYVALKEEATDE